MTPQAALSWLRLWQHTLPEAGEVAECLRGLARQVTAAQRETAKLRRRESEAQRQKRTVARRLARLPKAGKTRCQPSN